MLFSATLDNGVDKLVKRFLRNELSHSVDSENSPVAAMTHHVFHVSSVDAKKHLVQMLASGTGRRILFLRTKHQARKLAKQLTEAGIPSVDLHGNLSQPARDRNLAAFTAGTARVLVATDIAARGVHVDDVELVVHCDPPTEHKAYLHRSGRTARAGRAGDVVTVVLPEQRRDTNALLRKAGINVAPQQVDADSEAVRQLVGEVAAYRKPAVTEVSTQQAPARSAQSRRPRGGGGGGGGQRSAAPRAQRTGQPSRRGADAPATHGRRRASRPAGMSAR
jgi:superfamily II DNA/RNA helicase